MGEETKTEETKVDKGEARSLPPVPAEDSKPKAGSAASNDGAAKSSLAKTDDHKVIPNLAEELHKRAVAEATATADASYRPSAAMLDSDDPELLIGQVDGVLLSSEAAYSNATLTYQAKNVPIKLRSELEIPIHVSTSGSVVQYKLTTLNYDIGFSIVAYRGLPPSDNHRSSVAASEEAPEEDASQGNGDDDDDDDDDEASTSHKSHNAGEMVVVREMARVNSHLQPIVGKFLVGTVPTRIVFKLDNEYSWFREKIISYEITVTPPDYKTIVAGRRRRAKSALTILAEDTQDSKRQLQETQAQTTQLTQSIQSLKQQLAKQEKALKLAKESESMLQTRLQVRAQQTEAIQHRLQHGWPDQQLYEKMQQQARMQTSDTTTSMATADDVARVISRGEGKFEV